MNKSRITVLKRKKEYKWNDSKDKIEDKFFETVSLVLGAYSNVSDSGLIVIGNCKLQNKEIVRGLGYIYMKLMHQVQ